MNDRILRAPSIGAVGSVLDTLPPGVRDAIDEAYQRGLGDGYHQARGDLAQQARVLATKLEATDALLADTARSTSRCDAETVLRLAEALASWFVGRAMTDDVGLLGPIIDELLADTASGISFELCIHPDIAVAVAEHLPARVTSVRSDPELSPGEIRLSSDSVTIERVWDQAIERVRRGLLDDIARQRHPPARG